MKKEILVVSFGTSYPQPRENAIGGIEKAIEAAFPEYQVRRCLTSEIVLAHILRDEKIKFDNPKRALDQAVADGVKELIIATTYVMDGREYHKFMGFLSTYRDRFETVRCTGPLMENKDDISSVIKAVRELTAEYDDGTTGIVLVGHGTDVSANKVYGQMQEQLVAVGLSNYIIGTIEAIPAYEDVLKRLEEMGASRVVLVPLMVVAGDHALNDLAGEEKNSWKTRLTSAGYQVQVIQRGLGELDNIQQIYVRHVRKTISDRT